MTEQDRALERILVAHHEAAHAVAAFATFGLNVTEIVLESAGDGHCTYDVRPDNPLADLFITMAGGEADEITRGPGWSMEPGCMHDLHDITEAMQRMGIDVDDLGPRSRYAQVAERAGRVCQRFVRKHLPLIVKVAEALDQRGSLTGDDLAGMLPAELRDTLYRPKPKPMNKRQLGLFG